MYFAIFRPTIFCPIYYGPPYQGTAHPNSRHTWSPKRGCSPTKGYNSRVVRVYTVHKKRNKTTRPPARHPISRFSPKVEGVEYRTRNEWHLLIVSLWKCLGKVFPRPPSSSLCAPPLLLFVLSLLSLSSSARGRFYPRRQAVVTGVVPILPGKGLHFYGAYIGFSIPTARRFQSIVANSRALSANQFLCNNKSPYEYSLGESRKPQSRSHSARGPPTNAAGEDKPGSKK